MVLLKRFLPCIYLLCSSAQAISQTSSNQKLLNVNPGMAMRLEEKTFEAFKRAMVDFLPHFINYDVEFPTSYSYKFSLFFDWLSMTFNWRDIKYDELKFDIKDIKLQFLENRGH